MILIKLSHEKVSIEIINTIQKNICDSLDIKISYKCIHPYDGLCECRKPKPGMIKTAEKEHLIELNKSFLIGDRIKDIQAGNAVRCKTIYLNNEAYYQSQSSYKVNNHKVLLELLDMLLK